ncbi:hypothetical protein [Pseudomonas graminis]|jgi:hypothetical protein|uniref:Uncharacterized protein n=1 Tax=Pseudomonas graminis TaxID=158627 RepID=A0A6M8M484_9PSED|nr:hypothetical protein [Pseudomonas graminis]QKF49779.1 hypothetical protein FX982_00699 [Pseudomonas graminis]
MSDNNKAYPIPFFDRPDYTLVRGEDVEAVFPQYEGKDQKEITHINFRAIGEENTGPTIFQPFNPNGETRATFPGSSFAIIRNKKVVLTAEPHTENGHGVVTNDKPYFFDK